MRKIALLSLIIAFLMLFGCEDKRTFGVVFNLDGGSPAIPKQKVKSGGLVEKPADPTKTVYTFLYWQEKSTNNFWDFDNHRVTYNMTLLAIWRTSGSPPDEDQYVTVTFDVNGGLPAPVPAEQRIKKNTSVHQPIRPTKDGYKFLGWHLEDQLFDFNTLINEDITLIAKWEKMIPQAIVKIIFKTNGGIPVPPAVNILKGTKITKPEIDPEKVGYEFLGWFLEDELFDFDLSVNENITLIAKWKENNN